MILPDHLAHLSEPKTLRQKQALFAFLMAELIQHAYAKGYEITLGDAYDTDGDGGHMKGTVHNQRLAVDLNLFKAGRFLELTEDHQELGTYWKGLHPLCRWGGDFKKRDGNHYSLTHGGRA